MAGTHHRPRWNSIKQRKNGSNNQKPNPPTNTKTLKSFLGQSNILQNLYRTHPKNDNMRQLRKKERNVNGQKSETPTSTISKEN